MSDSILADKMRQWLVQIVQSGGSDLHLVAGYPPVERLNGELLELAEPPLSSENMPELIRSICTPDAAAALEQQTDVDFSFVIDLGDREARFRANLFHADRTLAACLRVVPDAIPDFSWASFPLDLAERLA